MKSPRHIVYMNSTAEAVRPGDDPRIVLDMLKKQLTNTVLWDISIKEIIADKINEFYEVGPSRQLKAMMKRIDADVWKTMENVEIGSKPRPPAPTAVGPDGESPLPVVITFPGQGSQIVGMIESVKDLEKVLPLLESFKEVMGFDAMEMVKADQTVLSMTQNCQPLMFLAGLCGLEKLRAEKPDDVSRCHSMCGLSVGEYTALCAAGCYTPTEGFRFLKKRGEVMAGLKLSEQAMMSVVGLEKAKLEPICKEAAKAAGDGEICEIALHLFPGGMSVGGTQKAIKLCEDKATKAGAQMAKVIGDVAYHTSLMAGAAVKLEDAFKELQSVMKPPMHSVWQNSTGEPARPTTDVREIVDALKRQFTKPVQWEPLLKEMIKEIKDPACAFYECGPSKQLKQMMKRVDQNAWKNMENYEV